MKTKLFMERTRLVLASGKRCGSWGSSTRYTTRTRRVPAATLHCSVGTILLAVSAVSTVNVQNFPKKIH